MKFNGNVSLDVLVTEKVFTIIVPRHSGVRVSPVVLPFHFGEFVSCRKKRVNRMRVKRDALTGYNSEQALLVASTSGGNSNSFLA